jgi:hypothetical protein
LAPPTGNGKGFLFNALLRGDDDDEFMDQYQE